MKALRTRIRRPPGTRRFKKKARPAYGRSFELYLGLLREFAGREGHARVPVAHREGNFCLGRWVTRRRSHYHAGELSPERVRLLERLPGWTWDPVEERFQRGLRLLRKFARREHHARVRGGFGVSGFPLGDWVASRRYEKKKGRLSRAHRAALELVPGWSWEPHQDDFQEGLRHLRRFVRSKGHARVPDRHRKRGFALGAWVKRRRRDYLINCLSRDRIRTLEALPGWTWEHWDRVFEEGLRLVSVFAAREGHACVPARYVERGFPLGSWVNNRRAQYRRGMLSRDRAKALAALPGWKWRVRTPR